MLVNVMWQRNPLACLKQIDTPNCMLCNRERQAIIKLFREDKERDPKDVNGINLCSKIYRACRHKPKFHRFKTDFLNTNTDETQGEGKRLSGLDTATSSASSTFDFCQEVNITQ